MINTTKLQEVLKEALMNEWALQGHAMTSSVVHNLNYVVRQEATLLSLSGYMAPYANIIAKGTPSGRIPFSKPSGRGGKSLYITALQNYVKQRMGISSEQKSKGIAFAIAMTQKKEGMSTVGAYRFTKTGRRHNWIEEAFKRDDNIIRETIRMMIFGFLTVNIDVFIKKWQYQLNN